MTGMSLPICYNEVERCEGVWGSVRVVKDGEGRTGDEVKASTS
jgi:hypothetical protein